MARYAILLQKQNRSDEAIEQFTLASENFSRAEKPALDCLERAAQLDPENAARQFAVGELASASGRTRLRRAAFCGRRSLPRRPAISIALELLARAHALSPGERSPALLYSQALLRRGDAAAAATLLEPWSAERRTGLSETSTEALMRSGEVDRARVFQRLATEQPARGF